MMGAMIPTLCWVLTVFCSLPAGQTKSAPVQWSTETCLFYNLHFTDANRDKIPAIKKLLVDFDAAFWQFVKGDKANIDLSQGEVDIYFYPPDSTEVSLGLVGIYGGPRQSGGKFCYRGELKMPGPISYDGREGSTSGHPKDANYFDKQVISEVDTIYLDTWCKAHGGNFYSLPNWFVQGMEEYLGVYYSTDYWKGTGKNYYYRHMKDYPDGVDTAFGLLVKDDYNDGF